MRAVTRYLQSCELASIPARLRRWLLLAPCQRYSHLIPGIRLLWR